MHHVMLEDDSDLSLDSIFTEQSRPPTPKPTFITYVRDQNGRENDGLDSMSDWRTVEIRLVGTHCLWGHYLWNAARSFASYLDSNIDLYRNRTVLELGAGGGLPGLVTAKNGASQVVLTDYPDPNLIANLEHNVASNISANDAERVSVQGYIWGRPVRPLLKGLSAEASGGFHLIIMSDLIFNHSQHDALLQTCKLALAPPRAQDISQSASSPQTNTYNPGKGKDHIPSLLVFYSHHRPHLAHRDLEFFVRARGMGWNCEEVVTQKFPPMFPEDLGDEEVRSTVHGWRLTQKTRQAED